MITLHVNGKTYNIDAAPDEPLLWVLREHLHLTGTKFGCGIAECGACTVQLDGEPVRSCQVSAGEAADKKIVTIEGIADNHPIKTAWIEEEVSQCGYCQPGQIMQAVSLLDVKPEPAETDIDEAMAGNICRCGSYPRIRRAIHRAATSSTGGGKK